MRKNLILLFILICSVLNQSGFTQEKSREDYLKAFDKRVEWFVSNYDTSTRASYYTIIARYLTNNNVELADKLFLQLLKNPSGAMFWMFPNISAYIIGKDKMSDEVKAAERKVWKTYAPSRGDTENHWAMYYASLLLATEQWPNLSGSEWYNGRSSKENFDESKEYLFEWAKITTTIGQGEFDSPDYLAEYLIAATMLAEWAQEKDVNKLGTMLADYLLADFAVEHLNQQYIGGFSRIYERNLMRFQTSPSSTIAYIYFGVGEQLKNGFAFIPALTSYRVPEVIRQIALDRSMPYVHKEKKRVRHVIRYGEEQNPPVYKYTYMTKDYGIGSLHGGILQPIQQLTWSLRYNYGKPFNLIFGLHPYWSILEIGMFFPEEAKTSIAGITASKTTYNNPDKWTGGSPCERTFQHKNTLIALYDIDPGTTSEHINGFFPANLQERIIDDSGWIICKAGDTYVGWYPLAPVEWSEEFEIKRQSFNTKTSSKINDGTMELRNYRLRSHNLQNGYVVEVRSKDEIASFEKFHKKLKSHIPKPHFKPGAVSVSYVNLGGDKMDFYFPGRRILNGKLIDLTEYKLFEGPFLNAEVGSQNLTITYKDMKMLLDFKKLERKEYY
jgi:hypothetical protein